MRILLLSDIHSNWAALQAIQESYDVCLCMGDLVEYGPDPSKVIGWVRKNAIACVRGNHDHGTAQNVDIYGTGGFRYLTMATRGSTIRMISSEDRRYLAKLPTISMISLGGKRFLLVHATPRDPLDEYCPAEHAQWAARIAGISADYVCVGHTHTQFALDVGKTTIINPGSVGLQRDGNPSARYAIIDNGRIELKQIDYPIEDTVVSVMQSPFELKAKTMLVDVYRTGRYVHPTNGVNTNGSLSGVSKGIKAIA